MMTVSPLSVCAAIFNMLIAMKFVPRKQEFDVDRCDETVVAQDARRGNRDNGVIEHVWAHKTHGQGTHS